MNEICRTCANRGKVNGKSQEMICDWCVHSEEWRKDYYKPIKIVDNENRRENEAIYANSRKPRRSHP